MCLCLVDNLYLVAPLVVPLGELKTIVRQEGWRNFGITDLRFWNVKAQNLAGYVPQLLELQTGYVGTS